MLQAEDSYRADRGSRLRSTFRAQGRGIVFRAALRDGAGVPSPGSALVRERASVAVRSRLAFHHRPSKKRGWGLASVLQSASVSPLHSKLFELPLIVPVFSVDDDLCKIYSVAVQSLDRGCLTAGWVDCPLAVRGTVH